MRLLTLLICLLSITACIPKKMEKEAREASEAGQWDMAYQLWSELDKTQPGDIKFKLHKERSRLRAVLAHLDKARHYMNRAQFKEATFELGMVRQYDPENEEVKQVALRLAEQQRQAEEGVEQERPGDLFANLPTLNPTTWEPLDLSFHDKSIRQIYLSLGRAYGVNVVIDTRIRDDKITLDLKNLSFFKVLDTLMVLNRHFFKIIDNNTIVILEDNKQNRDRYDNQIIQTFYLSNITPDDLKTHLRQLGGIKEFAENQKLNAITIKGTAEQIGLAEKIITANDKAQPEVLIEVELLEVNKNAMHRIGIMPVSNDGSPLYRFGLLADPASRSDDDADRSGLRGIFPSLNSDDFLTIVPAIAIDFLKENGDSRNLANPHLRVTSGEEGSVRIGNSIPVAQTSFTNAQLSGSSSGGNNFGDQALTTFNYRDVGILIKVKPRVHYNNEITLTLELEVSSVLSAGFQPTFGQRKVSTVSRVKNGETTVLAGMLSNDERKSLTGIPGLSDIPILGRLFSSDQKVISQTDIIMTIRPVILRAPNITVADRSPYEVSTLGLASRFAQRKRAEGGGRTLKLVAEREKRVAVEVEDDPFATEEETDEEVGLTEEPLPAMLAFTPNNLEGRQDEFLEFQLFITNVENLRRGSISLNFDPTLLRAEAVEIGDFFNARGGRPLVTPAWNNDKGSVSMIITQRSKSEPFSGSGIMATVRFRAIGPGSGDLEFTTVRLETDDGSLIPAQGLNAIYEVLP